MYGADLQDPRSPGHHVRALEGPPPKFSDRRPASRRRTAPSPRSPSSPGSQVPAQICRCIPKIRRRRCRRIRPHTATELSSCWAALRRGALPSWEQFSALAGRCCWPALGRGCGPLQCAKRMCVAVGDGQRSHRPTADPTGLRSRSAERSRPIAVVGSPRPGGHGATSISGPGTAAQRRLFGELIPTTPSAPGQFGSIRQCITEGFPEGPAPLPCR